MAENDNLFHTTAFAGKTSEEDLSLVKERETQRKLSEGAEKDPTQKEVEMTSILSISGEKQEANSMTAYPDKTKLKKRMSGAQKRRRTREVKMAKGTWVERPKGKRQGQRMEQNVAPKTAKSDKPKGETYRESLASVRMAILIEGHPDNRLTEKQALDLELLLTSKIGLDKGFVPTFLSCRFENGALIINCADLESSKWLEQTVSDINPWQKQTLLVGVAKKLIKTTKIIAKLPKVCCIMEPKEVLKKIEAQNGGITPTEWNILHMKNDPSGQTIVLSVPELDATSLGRRGYKFYIGLHQVQAKVLDKSTTTNGGEGSSSQHPPQ